MDNYDIKAQVWALGEGKKARPRTVNEVVNDGMVAHHELAQELLVKSETFTTFSILKETLIEALDTVKQSMVRRPSLPVLAHVLLVIHPAVDNEPAYISLAATDLETRTEVEVLVKGVVVGDTPSVSIPGNLFMDVASSFPSGRIDMAVGGTSLMMLSDGNEASIRCLDGEQFPNIQSTLTGNNVVTMPASILAGAIRRVTFAAADNEDRPILAGVSMVAVDGTLVLATADGWRLAKQVVPMPDQLLSILNLVAPATSMNMLAKLLKDEDDVTLVYDKNANQLWFASEGNNGRALRKKLFTLTLLEGRFVNYNTIIPKTHNVEMKVDTKALKKALQTASVYSRHEAQRVTLTPILGRGTLVIESESAELGDYTVELPAELVAKSGSFGTMALNGRFFLDAVQTVSGDQTFIGMGDPNTAFTVGALEEHNRHIIMPMHIRNE